MNRGDVYLLSLSIPDRIAGGTAREWRDKYVVILQGGPQFERDADVAFVIASTRRNPERSVRPFEVLATSADGFDHDTLIDGRWVHTLQKAHFEALQPAFALPAQRVTELNRAVAIGLQLVAQPTR